MAKLLFNNSKYDSSNLQFIPAYSRFIAIIQQYYPDLGVEMLQHLHSEFIDLQNDSMNDLTNYDSKIRNIRFIAELAKFGVLADSNP